VHHSMIGGPIRTFWPTSRLLDSQGVRGTRLQIGVETPYICDIHKASTFKNRNFLVIQVKIVVGLFRLRIHIEDFPQLPTE
jgi:hypothetical protein